MKVLIIGGGGREHALAWLTAKSDQVTRVYVAPGNPGVAREPKCQTVPLHAEDISGLKDFALDQSVGLTIVGPEAPLVSGLADEFRAAGLRVFGPGREAAALEGSKVFAKELMAAHGIPTPRFKVFDSMDSAAAYVRKLGGPVVIKADGLAAGKGVYVCDDAAQGSEALKLIMKDRVFGPAGDRVIIEERLEGEEASFIALCDGKSLLPLASSQDHKPVFDGDKGPNTGGMGAYSPAPVVDEKVHGTVMEKIMEPTVRAMAREGRPYVGILYAGLMITDGEPSVLEFNVRMGDPEAQPLLARMQSDPVPIIDAALEGRLAGLSLDWSPDPAVCVVMASGGYPGAYEKGRIIKGIEDAEQLEGVKVFHAGTANDPSGFKTAGGRVLGVTARASDITKAVALAYRGVDAISWEGAHYRHDIGRKAIER